MRWGLVAVILLLGSPVVHANAAPTAIAHASTLDAVLFEPITFTDASVDTDGTIVSSVWTDDDGRDHAVPVWTHAFSWPGLHTVMLRTTDNDGASSFTSVTVLVRAPLMSGRAYALANGASTLADTGDVSSEQPGDHDVVIGSARQGALHAEGLDADVWIVGEHTVATATVASVYVPHLLGYFLITGVQAQSIAGCDFPTLTMARITQVRLNDAPLVPPGEVAPNTVVSAGGVTLVLNAQETTSEGRTSVTAIRVIRTGADTIEIGHAEAGATHCPYVTPT